MSRGIGLYIHIPFCKSKCNYCDFNSYAGKEQLMESYFAALEKELEYRSDLLCDKTIRTIFIGGGTPSLVAPIYIERLLKQVKSTLNVGRANSGKDDEEVEISIETNPGTLSLEKLQTYRKAGINRLSIGLQASQNSLLKELGRIHTSGEYIENIQLARQSGFSNINTDIMFGLPGQTMEQWMQTLEMAVKYSTHLSCYSLKIEEGTVFGDRAACGSLLAADDETDRDMYHMAREYLQAAGFKHYEISNFCLPGFECKHNLVYWNTEEYLGIGAGAHSFLDNRRSSNVSSIEDYLESIEAAASGASYETLTESSNIVSRKEEIGDFMMLGLRLSKGVRASKFYSRFGVELQSVYSAEIEKLVNRGLLREATGGEYSICLTDSGFDLANQVFMEFI